MHANPFKSFPKLFAIALILWSTLTNSSAAQLPSPGAVANQAQLQEKEGLVQVLRIGSTTWIAAQTGMVLIPGDRIRTRQRSRATLLWSDQSTLRLGPYSDVQIEPLQGVQVQRSTFTLLSGLLYFLHRDEPAQVRIRTPNAAAAIRGTEFNLAVEDNGATTLTMIDGVVDLSNDQSTITLHSGEQGRAESGKPPVRTAGIQVINVIQWCLYYPGVLDLADLTFDAAEQQALAASTAAYRQGDLLTALANYPDPPLGSASAKVYQAGLLLGVGEVDRAQALIQPIGADAAGDARNRALGAALQRVIAAVKGQTNSTAFPSLDQKALASEWLAQSYYQQSLRDLPNALAAARRATEISPNFGFAWARVAELEFSFGRTKAALTALDRALQEAPANAEAVSLKGFLLAADNRFDKAIESFDHAISLDGALGNAWLGRGLCRIRTGQLALGREDLLTASTVEPQRAVLRSYLGKAYAYTGDDSRAKKELGLAKRFDAQDPTAWLYSALLDEQENRINEAIRDLEHAEELNNNRSLYRSRLLLDEDRAVQSANLANIYRDAGMFDVSVREAARAVNADYGNYSAHLFLADSYTLLHDPKLINLRYETPAEAEYLVANLLAPVDAGPLSSTISQQEYSRLFQHDGLGLVSSTTYLSRGAWLEDGAQFGVFENFSYDLEGSYYSDRGERPNNDLEQRQITLNLKGQITPQDSLLVQVAEKRLSSGDLTQYYDPNSANQTVRISEKQEPLLTVGYHHEWAPGVHTLFLFSRVDDRLALTNAAAPSFLAFTPGGTVAGVNGVNFQEDLRINPEIYSTELQQIWQQENHNTIVGTRFQYGSIETKNNQSFASTDGPAFPDNPQPAADQDVRGLFRRWSIYGYHSWQIVEPLQIIGGLSYDRLLFPSVFRTAPISDREDNPDQISPKAGLIWTPTGSTTVRAAYTRSLSGASLDQSLQIEPSQVAGFVQSFRSIIPESVVGANAGARFETYDLSLEQRFPTGTYLGLAGELLYSSVHRDVGSFQIDFFEDVYALPSTLHENLNFRERSLLFTANQLIGNDLSLGARYRLTEANLQDNFQGLETASNFADFTPSQNSESLLHQLTLFALLNHPSGFFAEGEGLWNLQTNSRNPGDEPGADFWQFNLFAGYRFAHRRAELSFGILNLTDRDYRLDPLTLYNELPHARTFLTRVLINF